MSGWKSVEELPEMFPTKGEFPIYLSKDFLIKEKGGRVVIGKFTNVLDEAYYVIRETGCDLPLRFAESWHEIPE